MANTENQQAIGDVTGGQNRRSVYAVVMRFCKFCGCAENEHHEPDWLEIPAGCVCNWREWDYHKMTTLPPVCAEYKGNGTTNCETCEHDKECHTHNAPHERRENKKGD